MPMDRDAIIAKLNARRAELQQNVSLLEYLHGNALNLPVVEVNVAGKGADNQSYDVVDIGRVSSGLLQSAQPVARSALAAHSSA